MARTSNVSQSEKILAQIEKSCNKLMKELKADVKALKMAEGFVFKAFNKIEQFSEYELIWYHDNEWGSEPLIERPVLRIVFTKKIGKDEKLLKLMDEISSELLKKHGCEIVKVSTSDKRFVIRRKKV